MLINHAILASFCVPSFNRPIELKRLLESIDFNNDAFNCEILIAEDCSPARESVIQTVNRFIQSSRYNVRLILNESNFGYDKNIRNLIGHARGEFVIFMGDDDSFIPLKLDSYLTFLQQNSLLGYVLRPHLVSDINGGYVKHRYFRDTIFFEPGDDSVIQLFRKSVLISGFTFKRNYFSFNLKDDLDGTLLFQLFVLAIITKKFRTAYYDDFLVINHSGGIPLFGSSSSETSLYTPGRISVDNSLNFMKSYIKLLDYVEENHDLKIKRGVLTDFSKYSYPILSLHRDKGIRLFSKYSSELTELGYSSTYHYFVYYLMLLIFRKSISDSIINIIKKVLGYTPKL